MNTDTAKRVVRMAGHGLATTVRQPARAAMVLVLPTVLALVLVALFGGAGSPEVQSAPSPTAAVVDEDGSEASAALVRGIAATPYAVVPMERDDAVRAVAEGRHDSVVVIQSGFGASVAAGAPRLEILARPDADATGLLETRARVVMAALASGETDLGPAVLRSSPSGVVEAGRFAVVRMVFGLLTLFMFGELFSRAGALLEERRAGRLQRIVGMGVPYRDLLAAHGLVLVLLGTVQAIVVVALTAVLGVPWGEVGWIVVLVVMATTIASATGLGILISSLVRTPLQVQLAGAGLAMVLATIGGAFGTLEIAPAAVQQAARISPVFWSLEALAMGAMGGLTAMALPVAVLLAVGTLGLVVGVQVFRHSAP